MKSLTSLTHAMFPLCMFAMSLFVSAACDQPEANRKRIAQHEDQLKADQKQLSQQGDEISKNADDITKNTDDISALRDDMSKHKDVVSKKLRGMEKNPEDISKNTDTISKNTDTISKNTDDITKNTDDISRNRDGLFRNRDDISKNTDDISKNTDTISKNRDNTSRNAEDALKNTDAISRNRDDISKNSDAIFKNRDDISRNRDDISKNSEDITRNRGNISNNLEALRAAEREEQFALARQNLRRISDGVASFYATEHYDRTGHPLPNVMPPGTNWTPSKQCCKASSDGYCDTSAGDWTQKGWIIARFRPVHQDSFQYRMVRISDGVMKIEASGNPGCTGPHVVLSSDVKVGPDKEITIGKMNVVKTP